MSVCSNQATFDDAFKHALENMDKEESTKTSTIVVAIFLLILYIYAFILALKEPKEQRIIHLTLALVFGPAYVIAHIANKYVV